MGFMKFRIRCRQCGHLNMPDNNTRNGIRKTLSGEFSTCRGCGKNWGVIAVPFRPLVKIISDEMVKEELTFSSRVHAFEYKGRVPRAYAA